MKCVNLGCGNHYIKSSEWVNLDFNSYNEDVVAANLLSGIPLDSESCDVVYHSNILEHFLPDDGKNFMRECFRVLKNGSKIRIAIPDLEIICLEYLEKLQTVINDDNELNQANYHWILLELIDQIARNVSGGEMLKYWQKESIINEDYLKQRIGYEFSNWRNEYIRSKNDNQITTKKIKKKSINFFTKKKIEKDRFKQIGKFRMGGEVHQWMYDRYSIKKLLSEIGFINVEQKDAFSSSISHWDKYMILDVIDGNPRKPDSIFFEAVKE